MVKVRDFVSYLVDKFWFPVMLIIAVVCVYLGGNDYAVGNLTGARIFGSLFILAFVLAFADFG